MTDSKAVVLVSHGAQIIRLTVSTIKVYLSSYTTTFALLYLFSEKVSPMRPPKKARA